MSTELRWTTADLEVMPQVEGRRYEIIDGELYISGQPHYYHQLACTIAGSLLQEWGIQTSRGVSVGAPGIIFADDETVAPDVVWCSYERLEKVLREDGKLHAAPELVIEVLSPGSANEKRDHEAKLKLYSRRGVEEYWILDWMIGRAEIYRRKQRRLRLIETLNKSDTLKSPLLPGFACPVAELFEYPPVKNGTNGKRSAQPNKKR